MNVNERAKIERYVSSIPKAELHDIRWQSLWRVWIMGSLR